MITKIANYAWDSTKDFHTNVESFLNSPQVTNNNTTTESLVDTAGVAATIPASMFLTKKMNSSLVKSVMNAENNKDLAGSWWDRRKLVKQFDLPKDFIIHKSNNLSQIASAYVSGNIYKKYDALARRLGYPDLDAYMRQFLKSKSPQIRAMAEAVHKNKGAIDSLKANGAVLVSSKPRLDLLAHELGHASGGTFSAKSFPGMLAYGLGKSWLAPLLIASGVYSRTKNNADGNSGDNTLANASIAAGALPIAATLGEEGRASMVGLSKLKQMGLNPLTLLKARKNLGKAFGTYLLRTLGMTGAASGAAYALAKRRHNLQQEQQENL